MCIVSAVSDHYRGQWPHPTVNIYIITPEQWAEYQKLKKMAQELDDKLKQPDCVKPEVDEWEKQMEEYLKRKGLL